MQRAGRRAAPHGCGAAPAEVVVALGLGHRQRKQAQAARKRAPRQRFRAPVRRTGRERACARRTTRGTSAPWQAAPAPALWSFGAPCRLDGGLRLLRPRSRRPLARSLARHLKAWRRGRGAAWTERREAFASTAYFTRASRLRAAHDDGHLEADANASGGASSDGARAGARGNAHEIIVVVQRGVCVRHVVHVAFQEARFQAGLALGRGRCTRDAPRQRRHQRARQRNGARPHLSCPWSARPSPL